VTALLRGPDASLWIGTAAGIARYRARSLRASYATRLEAFPELGTGPVHALAVDERQRLWAGTDRGLLVHDGLDWFQAQDGALVRLPRLAPRPPELDWRFDRAAGVWQSARAGAAAGFQAQTPAPITAAEPAVTASTGPTRPLRGSARWARTAPSWRMPNPRPGRCARG
jgi:hypothetical protein